MRVIAIAVGYDGLTIRNPGDEFHLPEGTILGSWFKLAEDDRKGPASVEPKGKNTDTAAVIA